MSCSQLYFTCYLLPNYKRESRETQNTKKTHPPPFHVFCTSVLEITSWITQNPLLTPSEHCNISNDTPTREEEKHCKLKSGEIYNLSIISSKEIHITDWQGKTDVRAWSWGPWGPPLKGNSDKLALFMTMLGVSLIEFLRTIELAQEFVNYDSFLLMENKIKIAADIIKIRMNPS